MLSKLLPAHLKPGAFALMAIMAATRIHHFGDAVSLPDASLALFFLGGMWYGGIALFSAMLIEAGILDYIAISRFGVSDFCISPAYVFLLPTYAATWFGGLYCRRFSGFTAAHIASGFGVLIASVSVAFLLSNGSFFLLSGEFADLNWAEYGRQFWQYYPSYLKYTVVYAASFQAMRLLFLKLTAPTNAKEARSL